MAARPARTFNASANITTTALGTIQLTNAKGSCSEGEDVDLSWGGTFANAGKITVAAGTAGGTRELEGNLTNTGKISIGVSTSSNSLIENKGSITVANEAILSSSSGTVTNGTGGSVTDTGTGALEVESGIFNQGAGAAGKVYVYDSTLNLLGAGAGTFAFEGSGSLSGNVAAAQSVVIEGFGCLWRRLGDRVRRVHERRFDRPHEHRRSLRGVGARFAQLARDAHEHR